MFYCYVSLPECIVKQFCISSLQIGESINSQSHFEGTGIIYLIIFSLNFAWQRSMEASECFNTTEEAISKFTALVIAGFGELKEPNTKSQKSDISSRIWTNKCIYIYTHDFTDSHSPKSIGTFPG